MLILWRRLFQRRPQCPIRRAEEWFRPRVEALEERLAPANLTWVGPDGGKWSVAANFAPAQVPGEGDIVVFTGAQNTNSTMDLGGGVFYHIAGLQINFNYNKSITIESDLYVDVLKMEGGTIDGNKGLFIFQRTTNQNPNITATNFGTSRFEGGTIKTNMSTLGELNHRVTLTLGSGFATPALAANLTTDAFTSMEWRVGNMIVIGGKTITVGGSFLADSTGTIGNATANWDLVIQGTLSKGKGTFDHVNEKKAGGNIFKIASTIPGGDDVFLVIGDITDIGGGGTLEVQSGTLSVQGDFTQSSGSTVVDAGQTLDVTGLVKCTTLGRPGRRA